MDYKRLCALAFAFVMCLSVLAAPATANASAGESTQHVEIGTVKPYTWTAVDGLGRTVSNYSDVGDTRADKFVGVFYWSWHNYWSKFPAANISEIISTDPSAKNDANHPA